MKEFITRFLLGSFGSLYSAGANLAVALIALLTQPPEVFGAYAFFQVLVGLAYSILNATIGTPISISINKDKIQKSELGFLLITSNLICLIAAATTYVSFYFFLGITELASIFSITTFALTLRWSARLLSHSIMMPRRVMVSDIIYSTSILIGACALLLYDNFSFSLVMNIISIGAFISILSFGKELYFWQIQAFISPDIQQAKQAFLKYGRWSTLGVVATEITANFHSYLVTFMYGPKAFAPIAAALLLFRPTMVVITSLTQMERPAFSRMISDKNILGIQRKIRGFSMMVAIAVFLNLAVGVLIALSVPQQIIESKYEYYPLIVSSILWAIIFLLRSYRGPISALIQAMGELKQLSFVFVFGAVVSITSVVVISFFYGAVASLIGVIFAELAVCILISNLRLKVIGKSYEKIGDRRSHIP